MNKEKAIELLKQQITASEPLRQEQDNSQGFAKWKRDTEIIIENIFGNNTRHLKDFKSIKYNQSRFDLNIDVFPRTVSNGIDDAKEILNSMIKEVNDFWDKNETPSNEIDTLSVLKNICNRFHLIAKQLQTRHAQRSTLKIKDEYDVQDLFHSILHLYFDDIRPEEWTPSYTGSSSRVDFLLKDEQIVIEIKKTRDTLSTREIGEQLIVDSAKYQTHPNCKCLLCFVYDPEEKISNPRGLENDLNKVNGNFRTIVIVAPKR